MTPIPIIYTNITVHALLFATACLANALAWTGSEVDFPGDGQGWDLGTTNSTKYTGPDGSTEWFRFTWTASADDSDYNFKMVTGNNWDQDYGGNLIFPKNELALMYYQPQGDSASKLVGRRCFRQTLCLHRQGSRPRQHLHQRDGTGQRTGQHHRRVARSRARD